MNILVLGAGEVGFHIALRLASEGHDVAVVDCSKERIQRVYNTAAVSCYMYISSGFIQ